MARKSPAQGAVARQIEFSPSGRTRVQVTFDEPELSSDAPTGGTQVHGLGPARSDSGCPRRAVGYGYQARCAANRQTMTDRAFGVGARPAQYYPGQCERHRPEPGLDQARAAALNWSRIPGI